MSIAPGSLALTYDVELVVFAAAEAFGVTPAELVGPGRDRPLVWYRQIAMRAARLGGHSLAAIGLAFDRDHTTVLHACQRVEANPDFELRARIIADEIANTPRSLF